MPTNAFTARIAETLEEAGISTQGMDERTFPGERWFIVWIARIPSRQHKVLQAQSKES